MEFGIAPRSGLDMQVTVVPVGMVKGLEVDASVVVEPAGIVGEEAQGHRALYVVLTRSTKRLCDRPRRAAAGRACAIDHIACRSCDEQMSGFRVGRVDRP